MKTQAAKAAAKEKPERTLSAVVPEPMKIILSRAGMIESTYPLPYRVPPQNPELIEDAAQAYAAFNNSDPFAYKRMKMHLQRGIETVSIGPEYRSKLRTRQIAATFARDGLGALVQLKAGA